MTQENEQEMTKQEEERWEKDVITRLAEHSLNEQKKARRWGIFFKLLTFLYITAVLIIYSDPTMTHSKASEKHTALVKLEGAIAEDTEANANDIISALRDAFENKKTAGVIIKINSPGGTPVQAGYIYDEIKRLREKYPDIPLYAVISDIGASGAYYVAAAADKIYADKASIIGSIGVRMDNFGFVDTLKKIGAERRSLTAGKNKALMDPFLPVDKEAESHLKKMLGEIHQQFITAVRDGRGDRLVNNPDIFTGLIWTGERSVELGLVDALANSSYVAREVIGVEDIVDYTVKEDIFEKFAARVGSSAAATLNQRLLEFRLH